MKKDTVDFEDGSKTIYYYDDSNLEIRVEEIDQNGKIIMTVEKDYDESGKCAGWTVSDAKGALIKRFELAYDENGVEIETRQYDNRGNLEHVLPPNIV